MTTTYTKRCGVLLAAFALILLLGCSKSVETSVALAREHVAMLVTVAGTDVEELQRGLPEGAKHLQQLYSSKVPPRDSLSEVREQLDRARNKVQDLRVAKSTFFVVAEPNGTVLRSDREPDLMAGRNLFTSFPTIRDTLKGTSVVTRGEMPEAAGVKGRRDGQFVVSTPIVADNAVVGVYASGWSWSAYAFRLQNALLSEVRSRRKSEREKEPLLYVYLVVDDSVFGAPSAPEVNAEAIRKLSMLTRINGDQVFATPLEVTGREFGLAVRRAPSLGQNVAVAVLRSET
ncbi:MAG TPA: hypothetical protein VKP30_33575 [Polyangiaceae bacterium]|nr:hypothetical protein [Polyangiaceae bacterium]